MENFTFSLSKTERIDKLSPLKGLFILLWDGFVVKENCPNSVKKR